MDLKVKLVAKKAGNTDFSLTTSDYQIVMDQSPSR